MRSPQAWLFIATAVLNYAAAASDNQVIEARVQACAACHGERGHSPSERYAPSIAGKPYGYLYQQLVNFRDGRRHQREMETMLAYLSDSYLLEMARYYASQPQAAAKPDSTATAALLTRGERLAMHGDAGKDLPACIACHGRQLYGAEPYVPGLLGLSSDYLAAQLGAWRTGVRQALAPDCMALIAKRMNGEDIAAVTAWISSQPSGTTDAKAQALLVQDVPMPCGAIQ